MKRVGVTGELTCASLDAYLKTYKMAKIGAPSPGDDPADAETINKIAFKDPATRDRYEDRTLVAAPTDLVSAVKILKSILVSRQRNVDFNALMRYVTTESSRYCPSEDHRPAPGPWDWRNPFTAYNCTWGFHRPPLLPESAMTSGANGKVRLSLFPTVASPDLLK